MKSINDFQAGFFVKQIGYKSFQPAFVHEDWHVTDPELNRLLAEASRYVGELNGYSTLIPNIDLFISMHVIKEATTSSRIEGTQTSIEEAILDKEQIDPSRRNDWEEVHNYIEAMNSAIQRLADLPLSSRLLKETHQILLQGVRGEHRQPGQFRSSQNWIGGSTLSDAIFIPPHHNLVHDLMNDLEKFIHDDDLYTPHLIKIGIIHYQFETIHPFLDGNGRIGRLLITLYLVSKGLLDKPTLYLSDFFERHRSLYYDNLMIVRNHSNLTQWLKFFLVGVIQTAKKSIQTFKNILVLQKNVEDMLIAQSGKRLIQAKKLLNHLYVEPSCNLAQVMEVLQCSKETASRLLRDLIKMGLLKEITGYRRNRIFVFEPYVRLFLDEKPL